MQVLVNDHDAVKCAKIVVSKYGVDKAIPQFYIKWITNLSFALKMTQFLVCEHYYFINRRKILAVTTQLEQLRKESLKKFRLERDSNP